MKVKLVQAGNSGRFVLTPQLRVDLNVTTAVASTEGDVVSVDTANDTLVILLGEEEVNVAYDETTVVILLPADLPEAPTGTEADLETATSVRVGGEFLVDASVVASTISILAP